MHVTQTQGSEVFVKEDQRCILTDLQKEHRIHPAHHPVKLWTDPQSASPEKRRQNYLSSFLNGTGSQIFVPLCASDQLPDECTPIRRNFPWR